ncbi:MAG: hypothetical protein Q9166_007149 [cf. Caloplaca sp. 2 TL-2023]
MPTVSSDNYGTAVNVVTWFLLVATILIVITRTAMKWFIAHKTNSDDAIILLASVLGIGQSVAISFNVSNGLGQHIGRLTASQKLGFQKSYYAAVLLYVPCVCMSNMAVLLLLRTITPIVAHRRIAYTTGIFTILWAGVAEVVLAFQCQVPDTWALLRRQCINLSAFWYWFGITQLFLDLVLVLLPWVIVRRVQMSMRRKVVIACFFGTRLTVVVAVIAQLAYFNSANSSDDVPYHLWTEIVCTQVVQSLSIITACVPYLKPFFDSLESGMIRSDDLRWCRGPDHVYTPSRSRHSPAMPSSRIVRSPNEPVPAVVEMNERVRDMPELHKNDDADTGHPAFRLQRPQVVVHPSTQSVPRDRSIFRKPITHDQDADSDSQTSRSEILRKMRFPNRPRVSRART